MQPAMMTTTRHKTKRQFLGFSRRNLASFMSMVLFVLYLISAATTIRSYWELSSSISIISDIAPHFLGSASSDSRRNLSTKSTEASSATNNASASTNSPHKHSAVGRLTLPNTWQHLAVLEKVTNLTYVDSLVHALENRSRVYFPGPWDGAGIVVEEFKLVLFTQGKVACTVFKQLARRMMHLNDWRKHVEPNIPHNPKHNGLTYLYHYKTPDALTILTSPEWTRALFVRDPKERTLSAYLDKGARNQGNYVTRHCCPKEKIAKDVLGANFTTCGERASASFLGFLQVVKEQCCCDPHWKPQSKRIDGAFRPFVNFVGHFDRVQDETRRLLTETSIRLGRGEDDLWDQFGASGWGPNRTDAIFSESTHAKHQTSAISKTQQYYNSTVEALVDEIYGNDYRDPMLNFAPL